MVKGRTKVNQVLVAKCVGVDRYLQAASLAANTREDRKRDKLESLLTLDQCGGFLPLPEFPRAVPLMAAALRDLELLPLDEISTKYRIIASIDSPFRERIAWAYLQVAGRPGVPDCDMTVLIQAIINATTVKG
jgi:hypothetical protein